MYAASGEAFEAERFEIHRIPADFAHRAQHQFLLAGGGGQQNRGGEQAAGHVGSIDGKHGVWKLPDHTPDAGKLDPRATGLAESLGVLADYASAPLVPHGIFGMRWGSSVT